MDGWPASLFVCTYYIICPISSVCQQFHVRWNHLVCPSTVPAGTVTERDNNKGALPDSTHYLEISLMDITRIQVVQ